MRNPNGYGTVFKLSGNRRRPYCCRLTVGFNDKGHPIYRVLGYFAKKQDAMQCLANYHKTPYNLEETTVDDVIEKVLSRGNFSEYTLRAYRSVYKVWIAKEIGNVKLSDLKLQMAQAVIDKASKSHKQIQNVLSLLEHYAVEFDYITKPFASYLRHQKIIVQKTKTVLTKAEIAVIHKLDNTLGRILRTYLYTGFRKMELVSLRKSDLKTDECCCYLVGGMKTEAGKNRIVPVHNRILTDVISLMEESDDDFIIPQYYRHRIKYSSSIKADLDKIGITHSLHEFRHTFRSRLDATEANQVSIDRIMGHASSNIGTSVYTHKTVKDLYDTIMLLVY